ncbi:hypothetical protein O181_032242 [Austropuccinia psidii MF-1]|uniref:Uncharacterized protein n=1 Tax=Austropuccinia psidii MF-1 TaxID=1389203 RepID=A0A9Q3D281_9BASI|nr:hypothetical protein [Austropuccinia psidii MF-1]
MPEDPKLLKIPTTSKWPKGPRTIKLAINNHGTQHSTHGLWKQPDATSSGPESFSLKSRESPSLSYGPCTEGTRNRPYMLLYTIMGLSLKQSNGETFKNPFQNFTSCHQKVSPFKREDLSYSSWQCMAESTRSCEDPSSLAVQLLVFHLTIFQGGYSKMFSEYQDSLKDSSILWTIQLAHTRCIQAICMALTLLGQFIFHCRNSRNTLRISR